MMWRQEREVSALESNPWVDHRMRMHCLFRNSMVNELREEEESGGTSSVVGTSNRPWPPGRVV